VRVRWLRRAVETLNAEAEYIARDNPAAAANVVLAIQTAIAQLARYPAMGRPGRVTGTRELIVPGTPYVIPYRVRNQRVEILRIFHAARKWPPES
jgi:toxin ParE1/3/4